MPALLRVRVTPRSARTSLDSWDGRILSVRVTAAPADGKANQAVIQLLAEVLDVPKSTLAIKSGAASREKQIVFSSLSELELRARLDGMSALKAVGPR